MQAPAHTAVESRDRMRFTGAEELLRRSLSFLPRMPAMPSLRRLVPGTLLVLWIALAPAPAAPPQLARITPPAVQPGVATTLTVEGSDLAPNPRVILPLPV